MLYIYVFCNVYSTSGQLLICIFPGQMRCIKTEAPKSGFLGDLGLWKNQVLFDKLYIARAIWYTTGDNIPQY
jgi:hypothetical protein